MSKYNLGKYNIKDTSSEDIIFSMFCSEKLEVNTTFKVNTYLDIILNERIQIKSLLDYTTPHSMEVNENIKLDAYMKSYPIVEMNVKENINIDVSLSGDYEFKWEPKENLKSIINLTKDMYIKENFKELIYLAPILSTDINIPSAILSEVLIVNPNTTYLKKNITKLDISLKPGESIVINSNDYTAYLKDENILYAYNGEWIMVSRELKDIEISGGQLDGTLITEERYL